MLLGAAAALVAPKPAGVLAAQAIGSALPEQCVGLQLCRWRAEAASVRSRYRAAVARPRLRGCLVASRPPRIATTASFDSQLDAVKWRL